jgi:hypothetical protein
MTEPTSDRASRENWGQVFRNAVASGRTFSGALLLGVLPVIKMTEGVTQWFALIVGLVALFALFPASPVVAAVVQRLPGLPTKGQGG